MASIAPINTTRKFSFEDWREYEDEIWQGILDGMSEAERRQAESEASR